jgi:hypothetical protein
MSSEIIIKPLSAWEIAMLKAEGSHVPSGSNVNSKRKRKLSSADPRYLTSTTTTTTNPQSRIQSIESPLDVTGFKVTHTNVLEDVYVGKALSPEEVSLRRAFICIRNVRSYTRTKIPAERSASDAVSLYRASSKQALRYLKELETLSTTQLKIRTGAALARDALAAHAILTRSGDTSDSSASISGFLSLLAALETFYFELFAGAYAIGAPKLIPDPVTYLSTLTGQVEIEEKVNKDHVLFKDGDEAASARLLLPQKIPILSHAEVSNLQPRGVDNRPAWLAKGSESEELKETIEDVSSNKPVIYNPLLRYLLLRKIESDNLCLPELIQNALLIEKPRPGTSEGTMRGKDPVSCETVRRWWDACRDRVASWASYACPTTFAIDAIIDFAIENDKNNPQKSNEGSSNGGKQTGSTFEELWGTTAPLALNQNIARIVEVGAGTGYWASLLRQRGADVLATDSAPLSDKSVGASYGSNFNNAYHGNFQKWTDVTMSESYEAASANSDRCLFMCYAPPLGKMAEAALQAYRGTRIALVGEFKGDTGTPQFEALLHGQWVLARDPIDLPQWGNTCYNLTFWRRKEELGDTSVHFLTSCASCSSAIDIFGGGGGGEGSGGLCRDRLTRSVFCCSLSCAHTQAAETAVDNALAVRNIRFPDRNLIDFSLRWKKL